MSSKTTFTRHSYMSFIFKSEFFFFFSPPALGSKERRTLLIKRCLPVFGVLVRPSRCSVTHSIFLNLSSLPVSLSLSLCLYLSTCLNNRIPPYLYGSQAPLLLWDSGKCSQCVKSLNVFFWSSMITKYKQNQARLFHSHVQSITKELFSPEPNPGLQYFRLHLKASERIHAQRVAVTSPSCADKSTLSHPEHICA